MKEIISGKLYDTDTATLMASIPPRWIGTFDGGGLYIEDQYYKTKNGQWFGASRCPRAPGFLNWLATGGFHSDWRLRSLTAEAMTEIAQQYGFDFAKLGLKPPVEA